VTPTNSTTHAIVAFLNLRGCVAWRNNTTGVFDPRIKRFRPAHVGSRGVADVLCCLPGGRLLEVEVKCGKDKLNPAQIAHRDKIVSVGGLHVTVYSFDELKQYFEQVIA